MLTRNIIETPFDLVKLTVGVIVIFYLGAFVNQSLFFVPRAGWIFIVAALVALVTENVVYNSRPEDTEKNGGWLWLTIILREPWQVKQPLLVLSFGVSAGVVFAMLYAALDAQR